MGRSLSPLLRQELANLDKDADSRKSAMKALKSYVRDLDSKNIPHFLAQVSESKESCSSGEYTISLYEVLARVHGRNIVPQIGNIMSTIIKTLSSSAGSFPLHQACSKVVPAMARYGIDPSTPDDEKKKIILSLCKPLSDVLMGFPESLSSGAALCLKALVESDNWRFASDDAVNDVCLRVAGALEEKATQSNAHMALVMALAKHNSLIIEAYARSLIRSGLEMLKMGATESTNSQKIANAILMINTLMRCVDARCFCSELEKVINVLENCHSDHLPFVRSAAFEALQTARFIIAEKGSNLDGFLEENSNSITGSNFSRRGYSRRRNLWGLSDNSKARRSRSPRFSSPESHAVDSFMGSPISSAQSSCNFEFNKSTNRKLWNNENCGVDVSLKDGFYSPGPSERCEQMDSASNCSNTDFKHSGDGEISDTERDFLNIFSGFGQPNSPNLVTEDSTPSPQRTNSLTIDDIKIFTTPRKLLRSLQDDDDPRSELFKKQVGRYRDLTSNEVKSSPTRRPTIGICQDSTNKAEEKNSEIQSVLNCENNDGDAGLEPGGWMGSFPSAQMSESVSSTANACLVVDCEVDRDGNNILQSIIKKISGRTVLNLVLGLSLIVLAILISAMWIDDKEDDINLVPT